VSAPVAAPAPAPPPPAVPAPIAPSVALLKQADGLLQRGSYEDAIRAYGDFLHQSPEDSAAPRVRATRDALAGLVAHQAEVARLREQAEAAERELVRLRRDLAGRQAELGRLRQELAERQAEVARVSEENENLRSDLERLKSVDLRLERRR
jgi:TolA-binding protein